MVTHHIHTHTHTHTHIHTHLQESVSRELIDPRETLLLLFQKIGIVLNCPLNSNLYTRKNYSAI